MTVKRFVAATARDCLRQVKAELGTDAIVVNNRAIPGGIEITAMSADSLDALSAHSTAPSRSMGRTASYAELGATTAPAGSRVQEDDYTVTLSGRVKAAQNYQSWSPTTHLRTAQEPASRPLRPLPPRAEIPSAEQVAATLEIGGAEAPAGASAGVAMQQVNQLMDEVRGVKQLLERQLAGFAWGSMQQSSPVRAQLLGELLDAGFSGRFARTLVDAAPQQAAIAEARKWARAAVSRNLRTSTAEDDLIDRGGVYALVGPTGVGKTTTTAKLAARCVVRYGAEKLALLTTDSYRIGAHEQLRIYGRILGVPVHVVRDSDDLRHTLSDLRDKHVVLIDTVGMSQRDRMVAEQAAMLARSGQVKRLLLLNATSRGDTLDDVVRSYAGEDLAGCLLTKLDETATIAPAIDTVIRHGLLVSYVTTGQRVPEDLHIPNRNYLLHRCFKTPGVESPHHLQTDEVGLAVSGSDIVHGAPRSNNGR